MNPEIDSFRIRRTRIERLPYSTTKLNHDRLPEPSKLRSMQLAYREVLHSIPELERMAFIRATISIATAAVLVPVLWHGAAVWHRVTEHLAQTPGMTLLVGVIASIAAVIFGLGVAFLPSPEVRTLIVMSAIPALVLGVVNWPFDSYAVTATAFALVSITWLFWGRIPWTFYKEWLLTDLRLKSEQREALTSSHTRPGFPTIPLSLAGLAVLLPRPYSILAAGALVVFASLSCIRCLRHAKPLLREFLTYSGTTSGAPGVWVPAVSLIQRLAFFSIATSCTVILVSIWMRRHIDLPLSPEPLIIVVSMTIGSLILPAFLQPTLTKSYVLAQAIEKVVQGDERTWWQRCSDRIQASKHSTSDPVKNSLVKESDHLFLGKEPSQNFPILLHKALLALHVYIAGRTGGGKTSIGLMQIMLQAIRGFGPPSEETKSPVIILDFKGDDVLFQAAKREAEKRGQKFRFFTLEPGLATHYFNPFRAFQSKTRSLPQLVQLVLDSLDLNYGQGYGRGYFSARSRLFLSEILQEKNQPKTFKELYSRLNAKRQTDPKGYAEAFELVAVIESLTHYLQLLTTPEQEVREPENIIQIERVLDECEVVYFWLPSALESVSVREVGKLVLFNLTSAVNDRKRAGQPSRQVYLLIDECQKVVGENFHSILQQARSARIATILANQSLEDLRTASFDLRSTIRTNTAVKMFFSVADMEEIRNLTAVAGDEMHSFESDGKELLSPRLTSSDLAAIGDHPKRFLLHVAAGEGYTQFGGLPVTVESDWPISVAEKKALEREPWPSHPLLPATVSSASITPVAPIPAKHARTKQPGPGTKPASPPALAAAKPSTDKKPGRVKQKHLPAIESLFDED